MIVTPELAEHMREGIREVFRHDLKRLRYELAVVDNIVAMGQLGERDRLREEWRALPWWRRLVTRRPRP